MKLCKHDGHYCRTDWKVHKCLAFRDNHANFKCKISCLERQDILLCQECPHTVHFCIWSGSRKGSEVVAAVMFSGTVVMSVALYTSWL